MFAVRQRTLHVGGWSTAKAALSVACRPVGLLPLHGRCMSAGGPFANGTLHVDWWSTAKAALSAACRKGRCMSAGGPFATGYGPN